MLSKIIHLKAVRHKVDPIKKNKYIIKAVQFLKDYFRKRGSKCRLTLDWSGISNFDKKVYLATKRIKFGKTTTYKDIAEAIGQPNAARAIGQALGRNPFLIYIPCHRIIKSDRSLGGFGGGIHIKGWFLKFEKAYFS